MHLPNNHPIYSICYFRPKRERQGKEKLIKVELSKVFIEFMFVSDCHQDCTSEWSASPSARRRNERVLRISPSVSAEVFTNVCVSVFGGSDHEHLLQRSERRCSAQLLSVPRSTCSSSSASASLEEASTSVHSVINSEPLTFSVISECRAV